MNERTQTYEAEICEHCLQTTTYAIAIDKGTVDIVSKMADFIGKKGINTVHPRKEMEGSYLTSNQVGNLSRPRLHGLIAKVKGESGNYLLTTKGAEFLRGKAISRVAIVQKATGKTEKSTIGYLQDDMVTLDCFRTSVEYWEGINYTVEEGRVVKDLEEQKTLF
jgi:hypothetical protein